MRKMVQIASGTWVASAVCEDAEIINGAKRRGALLASLETMRPHAADAALAEIESLRTAGGERARLLLRSE
jgi:hypothetical protein